MKKNTILNIILWIIQGIVVGIGAILPGVSGGTLCYAFGMYDPILEVFSDIRKGLKKHWFKLCFFALGGGIGFVGFAGVTAFLLAKNESVVLCAFVGLILGTLPSLFKEAGEKGRGKGSYIALAVSFVSMLALFYAAENLLHITIPATFAGYLICGVIWGLSFIVPGFSSSTLLLFFGIYGKMSEGISKLSLSVIVPLGIAMLLTLVLMSRLMKLVFDKQHSIASHCVIGFVIATTILLVPSFNTSITNILTYCVSILCGIVVGYFFTYICDKIKKKAESEENTPEKGAN